MTSPAESVLSVSAQGLFRAIYVYIRYILDSSVRPDRADQNVYARITVSRRRHDSRAFSCPTRQRWLIRPARYSRCYYRRYCYCSYRCRLPGRLRWKVRARQGLIRTVNVFRILDRSVKHLPDK